MISGAACDNVADDIATTLRRMTTTRTAHFMRSFERLKCETV
jgi:hypothetical protein